MGEKPLMNTQSKIQAQVTTTDAEIKVAIAEASVRESHRTKAVAVEYDDNNDSFIILLSSGVSLIVPRHLLQGLERATPEQLREVQIVGASSGLSWPALNIDHYIPGLIDGVFGSRNWMSELARRAGSMKSERKAESARENGRKGGRPRKDRAA
jgi:hypothetical protein